MLLELRRRFGLAAPLATGAADEAVADRRTLKWTIEPTRAGYLARFEELWRYRRILWFFSTRAVKDRYEKTTLGIFWLFARPLGPLLVGAFIFGGMLNVPSEGVPYFLFFLAGMSCWRIFDRSLLWVTRSLDSNRGLIKKVYFPRLIAPISAVSPAVIEFLIMVGLLLATVGYYYATEGRLYLRRGPELLVAAVAALLTVVFSIAVGLWTSVMQVRHKDVRYGLRYFLQFWLYLTPVIYPASHIPPQYRWVMYLNPMAPLVEVYKWSMLGIGTFPGPALATAVALIALTFAAGLVFFDRSEAGSVDRL
jgi:lipopolysaccharide transport system permease protein